MRPLASFVASYTLLASTRLTWAGVAAVAVFCLLVFDAQRRVRDVIQQMDAVNDKLDQHAETIEEIRGLVQRGGDDVADSG